MTHSVSAESEAAVLDQAYPVTEQQVRDLHERGWTSLPGLLSKEVAERLRELIVTQPRRPLDAIGKSFRKIHDPSHDDGVKFLDHESDPLHNYNHEGMAWRIPYFMEIATSKRVASAAVQVMRRGQAVFVQDISFFKPGPGTPTAMHQDYASWPFDRKGQINVWIALVDIGPDMGPLQYIEGSHNAGPLGLAGKLDVRATYPELSDRPVGGGQALRAGDALVHWDLTVHGAQENTTDRVREAYVLRFARTDTIYNGIGHPHYDPFKLPIGKAFGELTPFPNVDINGAVN
jgi:ectoine hydroxylase-related dioxygenase (phytanoyl-CoA dioxygenase family)